MSESNRPDIPDGIVSNRIVSEPIAQIDPDVAAEAFAPPSYFTYKIFILAKGLSRRPVGKPQ